MKKTSDAQREKIQQLRTELMGLAPESSETYSDLELDSYLQFQKSVSAAARTLLASRKWQKENPITIADVAPFYRAPPGKKNPPACLACLEDGKGGVARDHEGRPIICMMGVIYGNVEELKKQVAYALQRADIYRLPHHRPGEVCFVTEALSRESGWLSPSFRVPGAAVRSLFDFMKNYFPGSQFSVLHFCGLPSFVVGFFKVIKPFMSEEIFGRLKLKSNFAHLKKDGYVKKDSLLPHWDKEGTFEFDLDKYVEWRAREEGIPLTDVCARGHGRAYDGPLAYSTISVTAQDVLGTEEAREDIVKKGWGEKQGSGLGLFSSNRWKSKYLVLTSGLLFYFESAKVSDTNEASRMIPIDKNSSVARLAANPDEKKHMLCLSADREYVFGFSSEKEAQEWANVLQKQCEAAGAPSSVKPSAVTSLCVGDYQISQSDRRLSTTLRQ